jgi:trehalose-6-phosphate synthase
MSSRLIVVSNRLPITLNKDEGTGKYTSTMSSGGLVSALSSVKRGMSFQWIGWPGEAALCCLVLHVMCIACVREMPCN